MQQVIRQYAPEETDGNGTYEEKGILNEPFNSIESGTSGDGSRKDVGTDAPVTNEPINTDEGETDSTGDDLSDTEDVLFITEDILVIADFTSPAMRRSSGRTINGKTALITGASSGIGSSSSGNYFANW